MAETCVPCGACSISGKNVLVERLTADFERLIVQGSYLEAYPVALRMLEEARDLFGEKTVDYASVLNDVATVERALGKYDDAEPRFEAVARIMRAELGEADAEYATALNNLAGLHRLMGRAEDAEREFELAVSAYSRSVPKNDLRAISCFNNLALLHQDQGRYEEALTGFIGVLELLLDPATDQDPRAVAATLMNGAICSAKMGDVEEAFELLDDALQMIEQLDGPGSASYASALNNAAALRTDVGDLAGARDLLVRSRDITERLMGRDSSGYKLVCENLENVEKRLAG